eukprot:scaffold1397_cov254-Pinguiococcus_pyrenoidosus.AAC.39
MHKDRLRWQGDDGRPKGNCSAWLVRMRLAKKLFVRLCFSRYAPHAQGDFPRGENAARRSRD